MTNNNEWFEQEVSISKIKTLLDQEFTVEVDSPDGWVGVNFFIDKGIWDEYILILEDGSPPIRCNADHLFETTIGWVSASQLSKSNDVNFLTRNGYVLGRVQKTYEKIPIVDINVEHENHRYYTENVSSHNTGVGKSLAMCHMAAFNLHHGLNVLYITMEMSEERIAERIDSNLLDIPIQDLRTTPKATYDRKIEKLKETTKGKFIIKEYPTASAGSSNFRYLLNELKLKKNFKPDIIYIDYLNICMSSRLKMGANVNSYTYVKTIAEEIRGLAVEFDVPIVSATQVNRSGFSDSDFGLENTSESFGLPATVDLMFALISTEELEKLNQIMVKQLKNRYNDVAMYKRFVVGIDKTKMRLYNVEYSAQNDVLNDDRPVFDKSDFGEEIKNRKSKFNKKSFEDFI